MSRLIWDAAGEKLFETGVEKGVLYIQNSEGAYPKGVAWNGLSAVNENPSGAEATSIWADDQKYLNLLSAEEFGATVEAYTYPDEFMECDGSKEIAPGIYIGQQDRKTFGMCYRTILGNDIDNNNHGYKLHIVYGATAAPSAKNYATTNDSPEAITFSWEVKTVPVPVTGGKATATIVIDSTKVGEGKMAAIEKVLYGDETSEARLPLPDEIISIINA